MDHRISQEAERRRAEEVTQRDYIRICPGSCPASPHLCDGARTEDRNSPEEEKQRTSIIIPQNYAMLELQTFNK